MKNELEDIRKILSLKSVADSWKLSAIEEIVKEEEPTPVHELKEILAPKKKPVWTKKQKKMVQQTVTKEEVELLHKTLEEEGDSPEVRAKLSKEMGRTISSISNMIHRYRKGVYYKKHGLRPSNTKRQAVKTQNSYKKVTQTEVDTVMREKFINGNSVGGIAKLLGRTKSSINGIIWQVQTGKRNTSVKWKKKSDDVEVGEDGSTKIPRKFNMFG